MGTERYAGFSPAQRGVSQGVRMYLLLLVVTVALALLRQTGFVLGFVGDAGYHNQELHVQEA